MPWPQPPIEYRADWGAIPPKSNPGGFTDLVATVCHYTAANRGYMVPESADHERCRSQVRSIQRQHQSISNQSDIEYNALACSHGCLFEGRVLGYKGGANGNADSNKTMPSVCCLVGVDDVPTDAMLAAVGWFHQRVEERAGRTLDMKKHKEITSTSCPGVLLSTWVDNDKFHDSPQPEPEPPQPQPHPPQPTPPGGDMARIGPYLIQATGKDGTPNGRVYATDGNFMTLRWLETTEALEGYRWQLTQYGCSAPELAPGAPIEPIDTISAFGVVISDEGGTKSGKKND